MNEKEKDIELGQLLKQEGYQTTENRWFTRRVINRLPAERKNQGTIMAIYAVGALVCGLSWKTLLGGFDDGVVTVRDLIYVVVLAGVTLFAIISAVVMVLRFE